MSAVEDRLRAGLHTMAQQVQPETLHPLRAPRLSPVPAGRRWVAAAVAAAAAAGLVAGITAVAGHTRHPVTPLAPMPRYYLYSGVQDGQVLTVRSSATGAVLATLRAPAGQAYGAALAAAPDDRAFVVSVTAGGPGQARLSYHPPRFSYRLLRLTAAGRVASFTAVPASFPAGQHQDYPASLALKSDGTEFAAAIEPAGNPSVRTLPGSTRVLIVSVATGHVLRSWTAPASVTVSALSWTGDQLALTSTDYRNNAGPVTVLRRLNVTRPSGPLLSDSAVLPVRVPHGQWLSLAQLTPDGRHILAWTVAGVSLPYGGGSDNASVLGEYSARTGRLEQVLFGNPRSRSLYTLVWPVAVDRSGRHLLIEAENAYSQYTFGRLDGGRFTPLAHPGLAGAATQHMTW